MNALSRGLQRLLSFACLLSIFLTWNGAGLLRAEAAVWPETVLTAEAGIVMDADTGAVLFEKNGAAKMYPASITKVMTALVVLESCELTEEVHFSHDAVYNVDAGSSNAQIDEGDVLTVEDCLYALLLKSANEAANALAEHVSGSREKFAERMNEEALRLGCTGTNFSNPSGLFSEQHYTTARDMALIAAAAFENKAFLEIESRTSHKLAPTKRVPSGNTVYMEHKMLLPNSVYYDKRVVAGKTGYTKDAGNTLLTLAEFEGRRLVTVVLKDKNPSHYTDTTALLELGFGKTENIELPEGLCDFEKLRERLLSDTVVNESCRSTDLHIEKAQRISVPLGAEAEGLSYRLAYNLTKNAPEQAIAEIQYLLENRVVGRYYLEKEPSIQVMRKEEASDGKSAAAAVITVSGFAILGFVAFFLFGGGLAVGAKHLHEERRLSRSLREKRQQRLRELNISEEEFRELLDKKRERKQRRDK